MPAYRCYREGIGAILVAICILHRYHNAFASAPASLHSRNEETLRISGIAASPIAPDIPAGEQKTIKESLGARSPPAAAPLLRHNSLLFQRRSYVTARCPVP